MTNGGDPRLKLWSLILIAGCGLMFLAFFLPWWGVTQKYPVRPQRPARGNADDLNAYKEDLEKLQKDDEKVQKVWRNNRSWYEKKIPDSKREAYAEEVRDGLKVT